MDIKPYSLPPVEFMESLGTLSFVLIGSAVLALIGIIPVMLFVERLDHKTVGVMFLITIAFFTSLGGLSHANVQAIQQDRANYANYVTELKENLSEDGFEIISGTPDLHPNTQSSMLLSYEGKDFDCTLFSPENVNRSIVFSCGEAKLNLTQIKQETK